jgi:hypothetical protein
MGQERNATDKASWLSGPVRGYPVLVAVARDIETERGRSADEQAYVVGARRPSTTHGTEPSVLVHEAVDSRRWPGDRTGGTV